ncbi:sigma-70 family RNA polymerase sigma factor [Planktothrix sp. FACHB-1365]|uniref:sigma-70 family RNA polymerase sigma factor n=1 Tax=Planktothrix sp. FACHB-1365 TaxID=2692855 RepID=UPI001685E312|nr:sigma-70 family RNA polymerase sigma factor [Planktothrix sp. FACHB-1365]MBD2485835.1 sigma-70 family RNA polymerase sigma factor [Planktothrix sp. FACHB-1365]
MEQIPDRLLCQLIKEALQDSQAAETLAYVIDQIPEVKARLGEGWLPYYDEALPKTMKDIRKNINRFPQKHGLDMESLDCKNPGDADKVKKYFIYWVIMILKRDCYDVKRRSNKSILELDMDLIPSFLDPLKLLEAEEKRLFLNSFKCYIQEDPKNELQNSYPRNYPDCNCKTLIKKLYFDNKKFQDIASELEIRDQTLHSYWRRNCLPILRQIAKRLYEINYLVETGNKEQ